jgi:methionyl-tRNA formyltransferase
MVDPLRIVFLGTPQFAVPTLQALIASRHHVGGVVTQPDRPRGRGQRVSHAPVKAVAVERGLPVLQPGRLKDPDVEAMLRTWAVDLGVVAAYGKLIPESLLALPRLGMINVHASLLPKYRGAAPVHRAVINGDPETGVTIMRVERMLDAGPMLAREVRPIGPNDTSDAVEQDLAQMGARLLVDVVDQLAAGTAEEDPQDASHSTHAARLTKEEGLIDWSLPASDIHNRVRGLYPWPHAYTFLGPTRLIVLETRVQPEATDAAPGTVIDISLGAVHVATGHQGSIAIQQVQREGGRPLHTRDFLAGHDIVAGARFGGPECAPPRQ